LLVRSPISFSRIAAAIAATVASVAWGALTPLPDSNPQHAPANSLFPPIRVLATDANGAPVPNTQVAATFSILTIDPSMGCQFEGSYSCTLRTDANGVAQISGIKAALAGTYGVVFTSQFGNIQVLLIADPLGTPGTLTVVSGGDQRAVLGQSYAQPLVVRATHADGSPIAGRRIFFDAVFGGDSSFVNFDNAIFPLLTDANGMATSGKFTAAYGIGTGTARASLTEDETASQLIVQATFHNTTAGGAETLALQDLWWGGPSENGWGLAVIQHGQAIYPILFSYDVSGLPTWYPANGTWYAGLGSVFDGRYFSTFGSPYFAYDPSRLTVASMPGALYFGFDNAAIDDDHARFTFQPDGFAAVTKTLQREDITGDHAAPLQGLGDLWWGGMAQNGWGIAMLEQFGGLVSIWFTYDATGAPTWFIMPGGTWVDDRTYSGAIYRTTGSPLVPHYDVSRFQAQVVGDFSYHFTDPGHAQFTYRVDGNSGSVPIFREPF
jgi:hypothetical protein